MLKKLLGLIGDRRVVGALLILLQACGMIWLVFFLGGRWGWLYRLFNILSIIDYSSKTTFIIYIIFNLT